MEGSDRDKEIAFDIAMALSCSPLRVKKGQNMDVLRVIASDVVRHLKLCRWKIDRLPPAEPH